MSRKKKPEVIVPEPPESTGEFATEPAPTMDDARKREADGFAAVAQAQGRACVVCGSIHAGNRCAVCGKQIKNDP